MTPDGRTVIIGDGEKPGGFLVDLVAGTSTAYSTNVPSIWDMAFSPDGRKLAVYTYDQEWGIVDVASLSDSNLRWSVPLKPYQRVDAWTIYWSRDGSQIFTTGNGSVELWDARTLTHLGSMSAGSKDNIATVRSLPDGHAVMMAHPQGDVLTWDLRPEHLLDVACSLAGRNLTETEWADYVGARPYRETCTPASLERKSA